MFGHDSLPSMVLSFGAKAPHEGADYAKEQASLAHKYRNRLVEIERERRESARAFARSASPELLAMEADIEQRDTKLDELKAAIGKAKSAARSRKAVTPEMRQAVATARDDLKSRRAAAKELRATVYADPANREKLKSIDAEANAAIRAARAASGLYFGTYLAVEGAAAKSRSGKMDPKFQRWTGDGKVGAQLQGSCTAAEAFAGTDTRLRIENLHDHPRKPHAIIRVRIGSDENRKPIWCAHRVRLHRPIPDTASIKWAYCLRRRVGATEHWFVQLTISQAGGFGDDPLRATSGRVGIDLGWRMVPGGVRVAAWQGDDGDGGEVILPDDRIARLMKCDEIRGVRDVLFNDARATLLAWMHGEPMPDSLTGRMIYLSRREQHPWIVSELAAVLGMIAGWSNPRSGLPNELIERTKNAHAWKSQTRLAVLVLWWRENRFAGDGPIHDYLEAWRKRDKHLWNAEAHGRRKYGLWRKEFYRQFAVMLRRKYARAVIEDTDWRKLARGAPVESAEAVNDVARHNRFIAAPGFLAETIRKFGPATDKAPAENTTRTCHVCGHCEAFDAAKAIMRTCPNCRNTWDQDISAAKNLLASDGVVA